MGTTQGKRAIGVIRLSSYSKSQDGPDQDPSTSPARQRKVIEANAAARGSVIVGWAEDLNVSATKVRPENRPYLKPWLHERADEWDELIIWKLDRLFRNAGDFARMDDWLKDHGKTLVSTTEDLDTGAHLGKFSTTILAAFAEMEAAMIRERIVSSKAFMREQGRWAGGRPPFGYQVVPNPAGPGWVLAIDEPAKKRVEVIAEDLIGGASLIQVASRLNGEGIPSSQGGRWNGSSLGWLLRSRALRGEVTYADDNGQVPRATDGSVLRICDDAVLSEVKWQELQQVLDGRRARPRSKTPSLLLDILSCQCGQPMWRFSTTPRSGVKYVYYRCKSTYRRDDTGPSCGAAFVPVEKADSFAEIAFLEAVGDLDEMQRYYVAGQSNSEELAVAKRNLEVTDKRFAAGGYSYPGGEQAYLDMTVALAARINELASIPDSDGGYRWRTTGVTYAQKWEAADLDGRRRLMQWSGFRMTATKDGLKVAVEAEDPDAVIVDPVQAALRLLDPALLA